jgi:hypothetical protein
VRWWWQCQVVTVPIGIHHSHCHCKVWVQGKGLEHSSGYQAISSGGRQHAVCAVSNAGAEPQPLRERGVDSVQSWVLLLLLPARVVLPLLLPARVVLPLLLPARVVLPLLLPARVVLPLLLPAWVVLPLLLQGLVLPLLLQGWVLPLLLQGWVLPLLLQGWVLPASYPTVLWCDQVGLLLPWCLHVLGQWSSRAVLMQVCSGSQAP